MKSVEAVNVLLIEDNESDARLSFLAFEKHDLANRVHWVRDGEEALEFLLEPDNIEKRRKDLKLILLDLKLSKIDGLQLLQKIKIHRFYSAVPVVILTSSKEEKDIIESYERGANSYIIKPIDFTEFVDMVRIIKVHWLVLNQRPTSY